MSVSRQTTHAVAATPPARAIAERWLLVLIALTSAVGPLALQIYLPCLPQVRAEFAASHAATQLSLSIPIVLLAPALLAYGPLADRFGRRRVILAGLLLSVVGSALAALAPSLEALVVARTMQTIGGSAGLVVGRAILSDLYDRDTLARRIATVTIITVVAPTLAPVLGALLAGVVGWRGVFGSLFVASVLLLALAFRYLPETHASAARTAGASLLGGLRVAIRQPTYRALALQCAFSQAVFLTFVSAAPYLMAELLGRPSHEYGLYFILLAAGYVLGNFLTTKLAKRARGPRLVLGGAVLAMGGVLLLAVLVVSGTWTPLALFGPMIVVVFANGLTNPSAQALALEDVRAHAGTGASALAFAQQVVAAVLIEVVALLPTGTPVPLALCLTASALAALVSAYVATRSLGARREAAA